MISPSAERSIRRTSFSAQKSANCSSVISVSGLNLMTKGSTSAARTKVCVMVSPLLAEEIEAGYTAHKGNELAHFDTGEFIYGD